MNKKEDLEYDVFGNEILTQCLGSDGNIMIFHPCSIYLKKMKKVTYKNITLQYTKIVSVF